MLGRGLPEHLPTSIFGVTYISGSVILCEETTCLIPPPHGGFSEEPLTLPLSDKCSSTSVTWFGELSPVGRLLS